MSVDQSLPKHLPSRAPGRHRLDEERGIEREPFWPPFAIVYIVCMSKTIAIRVDPAMERALDERARASGMTVSQVVREALREALADRPLSERIGHLRGTLRVREDGDAWRGALRARNWRS